MVIEYTATEEKKVSKLIASLIDRTQKKESQMGAHGS